MLLSACLAFFVSLGTAVAQDAQPSLPPMYDQGESVAEITSGQKVCLMNGGGTSYNQGLYLGVVGETADKATVQFSGTIGSDNVFEFEATGKECEGHPTWRLKQSATGYYLKAYQMGGEGLGATAFTTNASEAFECTVLHPLGLDYEDPRQSMTTGNAGQQFNADAYILCDAAEQPNVTASYFLHYCSIGTYADTNEWLVLEVTQLTDYPAVLSTVLSTEMPSGMNAYVTGTTPGTFDADAVAALATAYQKALDVANNPDATYDECNAAYVDYYNAKKACEASCVTVKDGGYYVFLNQRNQGGIYDDGASLKGTAAYEVPTPETAKPADAKYVFKAIAAEEEGAFYFQNISTGRYMGRTTTTSAQVPSTETNDYAISVAVSLKNEASIYGCFALNAPSCPYHLDASNKVVRWTSTGMGNLFKIVDVDNVSEILEGMVEQDKLNTSLSTLAQKASILYNKARHYDSDATPNTDFSAQGLVSDVASLSTNAQSTGEATTDNPTQGYLVSLLDDNFATYFHSDWNTSSAPAAYHYIQADLGEAIQTFTIKYSQRHNNNSYPPAKIRVYGADSPEGPWVMSGVYGLTYDYALSDDDAAAAGITLAGVKNSFAGICGINLEAPHRYVRLEVIENRSAAGLVNGYPMFYLSELRFYPATYSAAQSPAFEAVDATVAAALAAQIQAAFNEVVAEKATQETIDALQAAYDAFVAQFPDVDVLKAAISDAETLANKENMPIGTELGQFSQESFDALKATISEKQPLVDEPVLTLDQINSAIADLEKSVAAFKSSLVLPEAGKVYVLRGMTTSAENTRALNAAIYAIGNNTSSSLLSLEQAEGGVDWFTDPTEFINQLWLVESVGDGQITLRNLGTGTYIGKQNELSESLPSVSEPTSLGIQSCFVTAGFNLIVGDGTYANFGGGVESIVAWNSASGTDNSSIKFEEVDPSYYIGNTYWYWPETSGPSVMTLPFAISSDFGSAGKAYDVAGIYNEGEEWSVELTEFSESVIPAGMPFVFVPEEGAGAFTTIADRTFLTVETAATDILDMDYATAAVPSAGGKLVGTLTEMDSEGEARIPYNSVVFSGGKPVIVGATSEASALLADANSGYITWTEGETLTEKSDLSIALPGAITSGIGHVTFVDANADVDVYTISGVKVRQNVKNADATKGLPAGVYVVGGRKVLVK